MFRPLLSLLVFSGLATAAPKPRDLICDICIDVVTDLDTWLTSDATEGEIVHFMESVSSLFHKVITPIVIISIV